MERRSSPLLRLWFFAALASACGTVPVAPCDVSTCPGCCTDDGVCRPAPSPESCGAGGGRCVACQGGQQCVAGVCVAAPPDVDGGETPGLDAGGPDGGPSDGGVDAGTGCPAGTLSCGGACAPCATPANAVPLCAGSACEYRCATGFHLCGSLCLSNTSPQSCGASCTPCSGLPNATATCVAGTCGFTCNGGFELEAGACVAAPRWRLASPARSPAARAEHAMADDPVRERVVLFGGDTQSGRLRDTWEWDGSSWTERTPAQGGPPARKDAAMAFLPSRGTVILFGGNGANTTPLADTWAWDGTTWVELTPTTRPPARYAHRLATDTARGVIVLFGGYASGYLDDTWEFDGTTWTQRTPATRPGARASHGLVYDRRRQRTVLFGGRARRDTWEWDGATWAGISPTSAPLSRADIALAYDSARGFAVMFGGWDGTNMVVTQNTWEYDGVTWAERPLSQVAPAREQHAMTYDEARDQVVLFGGQDATANRQDTWLYGR